MNTLTCNHLKQAKFKSKWTVFFLIIMGIDFLRVSENYSCKDKWIRGQWSCQYNVIWIATWWTSNFIDQLNIEMDEKWCSTNVDETSVIDFISINKFSF